MLRFSREVTLWPHTHLRKSAGKRNSPSKSASDDAPMNSMSGEAINQDRNLTIGTGRKRKFDAARNNSPVERFDRCFQISQNRLAVGRWNRRFVMAEKGKCAYPGANARRRGLLSGQSVKLCLHAHGRCKCLIWSSCRNGHGGIQIRRLRSRDRRSLLEHVLFRFALEPLRTNESYEKSTGDIAG